MPDVRVGFAGLGRMGRLMAANIANAGFSLTVYNRTRAPADEFAVSHDAAVAADPKALFAAADVVVTMLADGDALHDVYRQARPELRTGHVGVDMGTSGTEAVSAVRALMEAANGRLVDAPVSGSTPAAEAASLLIMVGGSAEDFARVRPVLDVVGKPELVGPPGAGAALKLTINSILYAVNQAFAEGVALAESAGVAPSVTHDVVTRSAAGAPMIGYRRAQYLDPEGAPVTFTLDLAAKDLRLALALAADGGVAMPQLERTLDIVDGLISRGHGGRDLGYVVKAARQV